MLPETQDEVLGRAFDRRLINRLWDVTRPHRRLIVGSLLLFPVLAGLELAQPYLLKVAIDRHILVGDWVGLTSVAAIYVVVLAALYGLRAAEAFLMHLTGQRLVHDLRASLFGHLLRLEARYFDRNPVGRLMTRVLNDVETVNDAVTSGLFAIVADVVTLLGVVAIMLWMNWRLALVTFAIVPILTIVAAFFRVRARDAYREVRRRLAMLNGFLQESLQGMTVIQLFVREERERAEFSRLTHDYRRALFGSTIYESSLYASVEALGSIALAALLWYGGHQIADEALTFGALVAFIQYTNRFFLPIRDLGAKYTVMQAAMASSERIFGLLGERPALVTPPAPQAPSPVPPAPSPALRESRTQTNVPAIEFKSVWFAYDSDENSEVPVGNSEVPVEWVLRDCSFTVAPGEHVAIVGVTGEGKTTCARLLARFYDVTRGRVLVEGVDVREWDLDRLRRRIGIVFQDTMLFTGSVESNLRLGGELGSSREELGSSRGELGSSRVDGDLGIAELERAVRLANAATFIERLPRGLAEPLSERGANISHGQRQLLAIARALVYNPAILVLDEATSSVDPESESLIQEAMRRLLMERTTITIAHRLSTIQSADRILVLHHGHVHEAGTHADLLTSGGLYARFHELQTGRR